MTGHTNTDLLLYALLLVLPISALVARRVPLVRIVFSLASWALIFGLGLMLIGQRQRFDPYIARIAKALNLEDQSVVGNEVRIRMSADGHFWARAKLDGVSRRLLIDSGATMTALSSDTADAAGLDVKASAFPMLIRTANGTIAAKTATVGRLTLGDIRASDLPVVVSPAFGDTDVLGMNFLSQLKSWRVEESTLILVPHHPERRKSTADFT
ncbi:retropepsin-like aspartic protease family protein [Sphingomonas bacterium]|uniref:retropepsin-like aspartic protease family protein n=1 Tax=Sphingomonas bacterium TaxID=1895847 RepID=UPI001575B2D0|nr:TIGR02281 family clan AA aspartic protease [Sphingomonas bacterium]